MKDIPDDLLDLALELGGTLRTDDGRVFNSEGRVGARQVRPKQDPQERMLQLLVEQLKTPPQVHTTVNVPEAAPPSVVVENKASAVSWTFDFERNADGTIKRIRATPEKAR